MARPQTPTAFKLIKGTHRADRSNANEPEPAQLDDLEPPAHLQERSAVVWREIAPMLKRIKVLTEADVIALEMLCDAVADYRLARAQCGDEFTVISAKGAQMLNQWLVAKQMSGKRAEAFMAHFGMDPASRSRIKIDVGQGDLFGNGNGGPAKTDEKTSPSRFFTK